MKRLITCASLAAVGAAAVNAQPIGEPSQAKTFSVAAKLRGFYDDNYNTGPSNPTPGYPIRKDESWGFSVAPSVGVNLLADQTTLNLQYTYDLRWYEGRPDEEIDQYHSAKLGLTHNLSERSRIELYDSFVYSNEPEIGEDLTTAFLRTEANNVRNYAGAAFNGSFSEYWGYRVGYENTYYDYEQDGLGSWSALLDRIEHRGTVDLRRMFQPTTTVLIGYSFRYVDHTGDEQLSVWGPETSEFRNWRSHYGFVGLDHEFTSEFDAKLRVGAVASDYFNADEDFIEPYADATLGYRYGESSRFQVGVRKDFVASDVGTPGFAGAEPTLGADALIVYAGVSHAVTPSLRANVTGRWQMSQYVGGPLEDEEDNFFGADIALIYSINEYVAVDAGYIFDRLDSDFVNRTYSRNRFYLGLRATY